MTRHVLITGGNRGIGYELARQYAQVPDTYVISTARGDKKEKAFSLGTRAVQHENKFSIINLEVTDAESIKNAVDMTAHFAPQLDILILNAGINPDDDQDIETISADIMRQVFEVNTLAPLMLTQAFLPLLRKAQDAKIIYISSDMASLTDHTYSGSNAYCVSKAGLNMVMRGSAAEFKKDGIIAIAMDPGWVKTDMGGPHASLSPQESVKGMIRVIDGLTMKDSGQFWRWDGQHNEW